MTTTMSARPIWGFSRGDKEMQAALKAGWRRSDLWWERLQEEGNRALVDGRPSRAIRSFRLAQGIARLRFKNKDPRLATSLANAAFADRLKGADAKAQGRYATARRLWAAVPDALAGIRFQPRARSSLFHLRMEVRHWETYQANMRSRLGKFVQETEEALGALARREPSPHRLFARWRGEKPVVFDDSRKLLAACLLLASDENRSR